MRRHVAAVVALLAGLLLTAAPAAACSVCYGEASAEDSQLVAGAQMGIALLLGVTTVMLAGFAAFFLKLRARARRFDPDAAAREWTTLRRSVTP